MGRQNDQKTKDTMEVVNPYISLIVLYVNGLNSPIKMDRVGRRTRKQDPIMMSLQRIISALKTHIGSKGRDG